MEMTEQTRESCHACRSQRLIADFYVSCGFFWGGDLDIACKCAERFLLLHHLLWPSFTLGEWCGIVTRKQKLAHCWSLITIKVCNIHINMHIHLYAYIKRKRLYFLDQVNILINYQSHVWSSFQSQVYYVYMCVVLKKNKKTNSLNICSLKLSLMEKKVVITIFAWQYRDNHFWHTCLSLVCIVVNMGCCQIVYSWRNNWQPQYPNLPLRSLDMQSIGWAIE